MLARGMRHLAGLLLALALLLAPGVALADFTPPPMQDAVTDTAGKLSAEDDRALESALTAYRQRTGNEIAVLVAGSLDGESVEDVAYKTFNTWKLGTKDKDNGVLLVIAPKERKARIETGKGVGDRLTDLESSHILRFRVTPLVKQDKYRAAIEAGVEAIEAALDGRDAEPSPEDAAPFVRGAYIVDATGTLDEAALTRLEQSAAKEGRYWVHFAIMVVDDVATAKPDALGTRELLARRKKLELFKRYPDPFVLLIGAKDRRVAFRGAVVWHDAAKKPLEEMLGPLAAGAPDLESAVLKVSRRAAAWGRAKADLERKAGGPAPAPSPRLWWPYIFGGWLLLVTVVTFVVRRRRRGGSTSSHDSYSSSDSSYASSSYDSSSSSYDSSSSSDTSYTGGGGSSGGGGASDSW